MLSLTTRTLVRIHEFDGLSDSALSINSGLYKSLSLYDILPDPLIDDPSYTTLLSLNGYLNASTGFHSIIIGHESNIDYAEHLVTYDLNGKLIDSRVIASGDCIESYSWYYRDLSNNPIRISFFMFDENAPLECRIDSTYQIEILENGKLKNKP